MSEPSALIDQDLLLSTACWLVLCRSNYSGLYNYEAYPELARFGLVDFDWSNAKMVWAGLRPMDAGAMALEQAARNKAANPRAKVFVYMNLVKALPWFDEVRRLLQNQSYWDFFIPYAGCKHNTTGEYLCRSNVTGAVDAASNLYHDEKQSPGWTTGSGNLSSGGGNSGPDGVCRGDKRGNNASGPTQSGLCDCGDGVSCGEYLWGELLPRQSIRHQRGNKQRLNKQLIICCHRQTTGTARV